MNKITQTNQLHMEEKLTKMKMSIRSHSSVAEYLLGDMDGLRIRFPQQALIEKLSKTSNAEEDLEEENLELSSFNLSLCELGTARLQNISLGRICG